MDIMLSFKKEEQKIKSEMQNLDKELIKLNLELEDLKEDNLSLKRKNDYSALEKGIKAEKELNNKIKFCLNEISKLKKKLKDLEIEKEESKVIKKDMDKVLDLINQDTPDLRLQKNLEFPCLKFLNGIVMVKRTKAEFVFTFTIK